MQINTVKLRISSIAVICMATACQGNPSAWVEIQHSLNSNFDLVKEGLTAMQNATENPLSYDSFQLGHDIHDMCSGDTVPDLAGMWCPSLQTLFAIRTTKANATIPSGTVPAFTDRSFYIWVATSRDYQIFQNTETQALASRTRLTDRLSGVAVYTDYYVGPPIND